MLIVYMYAYAYTYLYIYVCTCIDNEGNLCLVTKEIWSSSGFVTFCVSSILTSKECSISSKSHLYSASSFFYMKLFFM